MIRALDLLGSLLFVSVATLSAQPKAELLPPTKMTASARAAAPQVLRYSLYPESKDLTPGNAITSYYRAFSPEWWSPIQRDKDFGDKQERWKKLSLAELKTSDAAIFKSSMALREVDRGARRTYCDWELRDRLREDGFGLLLPDLQSMRTFAALLQIRFRLELADGDFDTAIHTLQTGFALAKHVGEGPTMIHALVGIAIASINLGQLEELIQQPDAPNMYWALTSMPHNLIDIRHAIQGEALANVDAFPNLKELEREVLSPEKARAVLSGLIQKTGLVNRIAPFGGIPYAEGNTEIVASAYIAVSYPEAKARLLASGMPERTLREMTGIQVALIDATRDYNAARDRLFKAFYLPFHEGLPAIRLAEADLKRLSDSSKQNALLRIMTMLLPAVQKVHEASMRPARRIAMLRTIEAIRMHAAANAGRLPAKLSDVTIVPVPVDPATNERFAYTIDGDRFTLDAPPQTGERPSAGNSLRYEIVLRKSNP